MNSPESMSKIFGNKIFRVPDYQRGYAWETAHLKYFWEDLINLPDGRKHYAGLLTLKRDLDAEEQPDKNEFWLLNAHSYEMFDIVDGQQRLTTFVLFLQAFVEVVKGLPRNKDKDNKEIYIMDGLSISDVVEKYLFKTNPTNPNYRTYKFGYTEDDPSYNYMRHEILGEKGGGQPRETLYTLNLLNAKDYFKKQLQSINKEKGAEHLYKIFKNITQNFHFNQYLIEDGFDVFVSFETMNNRGKQLSNLEILKNRLIYLTSLYEDIDIDEASRAELRTSINDAWKEIYYQLGRNSKHPLNDDDFLRAHWIMYFTYTRSLGKAYINFLLSKEFSPQRCYKQKAIIVEQDIPSEIINAELDYEDDEIESEVETKTIANVELQPSEISSYVDSLKDSAVHWFNSYYPDRSGDELFDEEKIAIDRLNRIKMTDFRPLVMAMLKNKEKEVTQEFLDTINEIERFIFISFSLNGNKRNYKNTYFFTMARKYDRQEISLKGIREGLNKFINFSIDENGFFKTFSFEANMKKQFNERKGYYSWSGLKYFLYEYEQNLASKRKDKIVDISWENLDKNRISIEHVFPQTPTKSCWQTSFESIEEQDYWYYKNSIGNLLLLSQSLNSELQNYCFNEKKNVILDDEGEVDRNGYSNGSHSEIEISRYDDWTPKEIRDRGLKLLNFMEERWRIPMREEDKEKLLFLPQESESENTDGE